MYVCVYVFFLFFFFFGDGVDDAMKERKTKMAFVRICPNEQGSYNTNHIGETSPSRFR
jgi:hypothetical protein